MLIHRISALYSLLSNFPFPFVQPFYNFLFSTPLPFLFLILINFSLTFVLPMLLTLLLPLIYPNSFLIPPIPPIPSLMLPFPLMHPLAGLLLKTFYTLTVGFMFLIIPISDSVSSGTNTTISFQAT